VRPIRPVGRSNVRAISKSTSVSASAPQLTNVTASAKSLNVQLVDDVLAFALSFEGLEA
jgi:hypothetical protein